MASDIKKKKKIKKVSAEETPVSHSRPVVNGTLVDFHYRPGRAKPYILTIGTEDNLVNVPFTDDEFLLFESEVALDREAAKPRYFFELDFESNESLRYNTEYDSSEAAMEKADIITELLEKDKSTKVAGCRIFERVLDLPIKVVWDSHESETSDDVETSDKTEAKPEEADEVAVDIPADHTHIENTNSNVSNISKKVKK